MGRLILPSYTVVRDTREKIGHGFEFKPSKPERRPPRCAGMEISTLKTGDYSIKGGESLVCVERKHDLSELWINYGKRDLFEEECKRMQDIKYRYILIETSLSSDHFSLSPPQFQRSVPGKAIMGWLISLELEFGIHIIFVGSSGKHYCQLLFESIIRKEKSLWENSG